MGNGNFLVYFFLFAILTVIMVNEPTKASEPLSGEIIVVDAGQPRYLLTR